MPALLIGNGAERLSPNEHTYRHVMPNRRAPASVLATDDLLVPVDDGSGDHPTVVGQQEGHEHRNFVRTSDSSHWHGSVSTGEPVITRSVSSLLRGPFGLGGRPPDVHAVDADLVPPVSVSSVTRGTGQTRLGRHVGGQ